MNGLIKKGLGPSNLRAITYIGNLIPSIEKYKSNFFYKIILHVFQMY